MADTPPTAVADGNNSKVTLAVLQRDIQYLTEKVERYHLEMCKSLHEERDDLRAVLKDHEERLRGLENGQRKSVWADVGAYALAIGAGIGNAFLGRQ